MRDRGGFRISAGLGRLLEAMIAALVVLVALVASALGQATIPSAAQDSGTPTAQAAPIQRANHAARKPFRAARLTYLTGNVEVEQARNKAQDSAVLNMPLVEGTVISTGEDGQAEIEFEDGSLVRITPNSGISLLNMSVDTSAGDTTYQTRVAVVGGLVYAELRAGTKYQYSIDAAGNVVTPVENATVRINLDESPASIAVIQGSAQVTSSDSTSTMDVRAGQTARPETAQPDAGQAGVQYAVKEEIAAETWDQWNEDRDQVAAGEAGTKTAARDQYAGDQGYGWSDLDANGSWYNVPGQGGGQNLVWQPDIAEDSGADGAGSPIGGGGFDPYGYGSWAWTPAGYSWASSYGWGWLPYRCGQWLYFDQFGWGWQPGVNCGVFDFGGYGYGGVGFGVNIGRAPRFWKRPTRPIPGPGPVHPIIHGRATGTPLAEAQLRDSGRLIRVKNLSGQSVVPLPAVSNVIENREGNALGSALRRDYPVNSVTRQPSLGVPPTGAHLYSGPGSLQPPPEAGFAVPRSHISPTIPGYQSTYQNQIQHPASAPRPAPAPAPRPAPAPAPRAAPAAAPAPHSSPAAASHK